MAPVLFWGPGSAFEVGGVVGENPAGVRAFGTPEYLVLVVPEHPGELWGDEGIAVLTTWHG